MVDAPLIRNVLVGRTFTTAEVCGAAEINEKSINNWQALNGLMLASPVPGRGRPRQFCVLDAYLLAVMREIVRGTGSPAFSAHAVSLICSDAAGAGPAWAIDRHLAHYLVLSPQDNPDWPFSIAVTTEPDWMRLREGRSFQVVNLSAVVRDVDARLDGVVNGIAAKPRRTA